MGWTPSQGSLFLSVPIFHDSLDIREMATQYTYSHFLFFIFFKWNQGLLGQPIAIQFRFTGAALPKVSTMGNFFTITLFLAIRRTPSTSVTVTTMGRPSGMAATARLGTAETQQLQHRGQTASIDQNVPKGHFHGVRFPTYTCISEWEHSGLTTGTPGTL